MIATFLALSLLAGQKLTISLDAPEGTVVTGEKVFKVTVASKAPVTQVEFYVNDSLRETDTSTPYEFKIDSLAEEDGPMKLKFSAYNTEGESSSKSITVRIDNGLDKGADFHVDKAKEHFTAGRYEAAILAGRIALKAKPGHVPAQLIMSRAYLKQNVLDSAQKFAEDALTAEPNNLEAKDLLSVINLNKALNTFNRGGDRSETLGIISTALKSAIETRREFAVTAFEKVGPVTDANLIAYVNAAMNAGKYQAAANALEPAFRKDNRRNEVANLLTYAYLRLGRLQDAYNTMVEHRKYGVLDGAGFALLAITESRAGAREASDNAMREAILSDGENLTVRTAQAFLAIQSGNRNTLQQVATQLGKDLGQRSEVHTYLTILNASLGNFEASRRHFSEAVLLDPTNYDIYIERANEGIALAQSGRLAAKDAEMELKSAQTLFEAALVARPESQEALTGMALVNMFMGKTAEAYKYASAATMQSATYAPGFYTLAAVLSAQSRQEANSSKSSALMQQAMKALETSGKLDQKHLDGASLPQATDAFRHFSRNGRTPLLVITK